MPQSTILAISLFFHLSATAIWIGGLLMTTLLVWPEVKRTLADQPQLNALVARLRRRFTPLGNLSLAVLIVTGLFQMSLDENYDGFLRFDNTWSTVMLMKHTAIIGMIGAGLLIQAVVVPALERASLLVERGKADGAEFERLRRREVRLTWLNATLGVLVLAFSAWAGAL